MKTFNRIDSAESKRPACCQCTSKPGCRSHRANVATVDFEIRSDSTGDSVDGITTRNETGTYTMSARVMHDRGLRSSTINNANFVLVPPTTSNSSPIPLRLASTPSTDGTGRVKFEYQFDAPADGWDVVHNGTWMLGDGPCPVVDATGEPLRLACQVTSAVEVSVTPAAAIKAEIVETPWFRDGARDRHIEVEYTSLGVIDGSSFGDTDLAVVREQASQRMPVEFVRAIPSSDNARAFTVIYRVATADGDDWSWQHNGTWSISTVPGEVVDECGNTVESLHLDSFYINLEKPASPSELSRHGIGHSAQAPEDATFTDSNVRAVRQTKVSSIRLLNKSVV